MSKDQEQIKIEAEHAIQGLEMSLEKLGSEMVEQVDGLSSKQLRRALKASVEYIYKRKVETSKADSLTDREKKFIGGLAAIIDMGFVYQQHILKEIQEEQANQQGENNE